VGAGGPGGPACGAQSGVRERAGAWRGSAEQSAGGGASSGAGCPGASGRQRERAEAAPSGAGARAVGVRDVEECVSKCYVRRLGWGTDTGSQRGCGSGVGERA
jgi:hypothetical protein